MSAISPLRVAIAGLMIALPAFMAQRAFATPNETPTAFVHRVYALYRTSDNSTGVDRTRPAGSAFYATSLLDAFARDDSLLHGEEGVVDYDPICTCQAWENLRVKHIVLAKGEAGTVTARVVIGNFVGAQRIVKTVVLTLVRTPAGWRIADVGDSYRASFMAALRTEIYELEQASGPGGVPQAPKS